MSYLSFIDELTIRDHLDELEILDDTYFQKDRDSKIKEKYDTIMEIVEKDYANHGTHITI